MKSIVAFIFIVIVSLQLLTPSTAHAGIIDKIKAIYNTPERVEEMISQYEEQYEQTVQQFENTKQALIEQQKKVQEAEQRAEEFARRQQELQAINEQYRSDNEQYRSANEQLLTQNNELTQRLALIEQQQNNRKALMRKLIIMGLTAVGLILGYLAMIRIWRYLVWRRQRTNQQGPHI